MREWIISLRPSLLLYKQGDPTLSSVLLLTCKEGAITRIQDFRYTNDVLRALRGEDPAITDKNITEATR